MVILHKWKEESAYRATQTCTHIFHIQHVILGIVIRTCSITKKSTAYVRPYTILLVTQAFHIHL